MLRRAFGLPITLFVGALALTGCSAKSPHASLDVAIDGLYGGALSKDASHAMVGAFTHGGSYWQLTPGERLFDWNHGGDDSTITSAAFSPDGRYVMTSDRQTMVLWDATTGEDLTYWRAPAEVHGIAISNATDIGVLAALALDNHTAVIFNASRGRVLREFLHDNRVRSVDISADGRWMLSGAEDQSAVYWSVADGREVSRFQHGDDVRLVSLSDNGELAFSVSKYDRATVWRTRDGSALADVPIIGDALRRGRTFSAGRFKSDNSQLLTGSSDRMVQLWQLPEMTEIGRWEMPKRSAWKPTGAAVVDVGFNRAGEVVAIASNGTVHHMQP